MALHRKNTTGRRLGLVVLAALGMAVSGALAVGPQVDAAVTLTPKSKNITVKNVDVVGTCRFQARKVNATVRYTLAATGRPADLDGYRANIFTRVNCYVLDPDTLSTLIEFHPSANGASMYGRNVKGAVPFFDSYILCGFAEVKKQNGDTSETALACV